MKTGLVDILHEDITLPLSLLILPPSAKILKETLMVLPLLLQSIWYCQVRKYFRAYSTSHIHTYNKNRFTYAQKDPVIRHTQIFIDLNQAH